MIYSNKKLEDYFNNLSKIKIISYEIKDGIQVMSDLTFKSLFDHIKSKEWHSNESKTKKSHHSESLYDHCINTAEKSYNNAYYLGFSEHECKKCFFLGLLHDIGKPGTYLEGNTFIGFKGHGIVGASILENAWTDEIYTSLGISKDEWGDICVCTAVHMCGYFLTQNTEYHSFYFKILSPSVKKLLSILRNADQLSLVPHDDSDTDIKKMEKELIETQKKFNESINLENDITNDEIRKFLIENKQNNGIIFTINGASASGKTTYAQKLEEQLIGNGVKKTHILTMSRDIYIVNYYLKINKLDYISEIEITPELYIKAYEFYNSNKKDNFNIINALILYDISKILISGGIVIIHSLITMFPAISNIIPELAINTIKISIWLNRNKLIKKSDSEDRLGFSIDSQIKLHGNLNIFNPLPQNLNWYNLISSTEFNDLNNSKYRPHLTLVTSWNGCSEKNIYYILEKLIYNIYIYNQSISRIPTLIDVYNMTDIEILEHLKTIENIKTFFTLHNYRVYIMGNTIGIKYIDGINKLWRPLWARKMRGKYYYIHDNGKITVIKDTLIRGMEILPEKYIKAGILETQDTDIKRNNSIFDDIQQELIKQFKCDNILTRETYITLKVDGSLIIINIYPVKSEQYLIMSNIIESYADNFTKLLYNYCKENKLPLITISTNGTLFIGDLMQDYFLTSIQNLISFEVKSLSDWVDIIPIFTKLILEYYKHLTKFLKNNNFVSICFESICKNRTTFLGKIHTELAVNYDNNNLILLGLCNNNKYYPHFKLPLIIFTQPWYLSINNTSQVFQILDMMHQIVCDEIDINELFKLNKDIKTLISRDIHVEGLILLSYLENGSVDYEKIKTQEYYTCHNIKKDNLSIVFNYHKNYDNYYPIIKNIRNFTENLNPSLLKIINVSFNMLKKEINKESSFYIKLNDNTKKCIDKVINNIELENDINNNIGIALKIFLNNKNIIENINELFIPIIKDIYINRTAPIDEFIIFLKHLLMSTKPWINNPEIIIENLQNENIYNKIVGELYILIIGL